jgi:hypothetical protein
MSRTTSPAPLRSETNARLRLDEFEAVKGGAGCTSEHDAWTGALEAAVVRLDEADEVAAP